MTATATITRPEGAPARAEAPNDPAALDTGRPIAISPRYWATIDGARHGHNGRQSFVLPPADEVQALLVRRAYHKAKLDLAWNTLQHVRVAKVHVCEFRWDEAHLGAMPTAATGSGRAQDLEAADLRLSDICRHHEGEFKRLDAEIRGRGANPDFILVG